MVLGQQEKTAVRPPRGKILVAGATGGTGKRVVRQLLQRNYPVRVLVRSIEIARPLFGDSVEYYEGDITIPGSLKPDLMAGVRAVVCCTGTRVQPVGGDTEDRAKYYQGVKFYQPEIAESTPEAVEYKGIQNLLAVATRPLKAASPETPLFDFANPSEDLQETWGAVDDVVMGGVSESGIRLGNGVAIFGGNVSTANSGGFASVRTRNFSPPLDLSTYEGIQVRLQGDGKRYKFILRCEGKWDGLSYCYSFDTIYNIWQTIRIPFADFVPVFRAKTVKDAGAFDPSRTYSMQLMLSKFEYDGELNPKFQSGSFRLQVESIQAYRDATIPKWVAISSAGVTRPGRPGLNLEEEPPAVRMNEMLGGILTWKLRGEEAARDSELPYTIIRPCALTEQPGDKPLYCEQGDNLKGQVSRDSIARLCVEALECPEACNKTFEVREGEEGGETDWETLFANLQGDR